MRDLDGDLAAEGLPEDEFVAGIAARLPRKRVAAGALVRDPLGRLLFVEPAYKPHLEIPGGVAEQGESPADACRRECREELGTPVEPGRLLVVDWVPAQGVWSDALLFVFDGGVLAAAPEAADPELRGTAFLTLAEASPRLAPSMVRRLAAAVEALEDGGPRYLEFGR